MLDPTEHDISTVHKNENTKNQGHFLLQNFLYRGWHFNIDEQEKLMTSRDKHTQKREFRNIVARPEHIKCPMPMHGR